MTTRINVPVKRQTDIEKVSNMVTQILYAEEEIKSIEAQLENRKEALRKFLRKMPNRAIVLPNGYGYKLQSYKQTKVKNELAAKEWALENPAARMNISVAAITKAFEGQTMPKWVTRLHAEKLMPVKPNGNKD